MRWLIEPDVFQGDAEPLMEALDKLDIKYTRCKFGVPYEKYIEEEGREKTMFYGSLQFGKLLQKKSAFVKVFCNLPKLECLHYYPKFGDRLLNSGYLMLPFGDLQRKKKQLFSSGEECFFVRPSSGYKTFTGGIITHEEWDDRIHELERRIDPETLVVVSAPRRIIKEWRAVVVDGRVITGGQYKNEGSVVRINGLPPDVSEFAQQVVDSVKYNPDPAWVLDVCETEFVKKVLEVGSFSCSGLYACDCEAVVKAIEGL